MTPQPGEVFDLTFPVRPDLGTVRVQVLAADEATPSTPCGARTVPIKVISGQIPKADVPGKPAHVVGPGEITTIPLFIPRWAKVSGGPA